MNLKKTSKSMRKMKTVLKKTLLARKPKVPLPPFILWNMDERRKKIQEGRKAINAKEGKMSTKMSREDEREELKESWAKIDSETLEKYKIIFREDQKRYNVEYREWFENGGEAALEHAKCVMKEASEQDKNNSKAWKKGSINSNSMIDDDITFTRRPGDLVYFGPKAAVKETKILAPINRQKGGTIDSKRMYKVLEKSGGGLLFECKICGEKRTQSKNMVSHLLNIHEYNHVEEFVIKKCTKCEFNSRSKVYLVRHMKNVHGSEELYSKCKLCPYKTEMSLREHMEEVHLKLGHTCDQCGHKSRRKSYLRRHKQTSHQGIVFSCDMCSFTYTQLYTLRNHTRNIHEDIVCDSCNITINGYIALNRHKIKAHADNLKCNVCHYKYPVRKYLKEHIKFNHPEEIISCTKCDYKTIKKCVQDMRKHERKDHNIS